MPCLDPSLPPASSAIAGRLEALYTPLLSGVCHWWSYPLPFNHPWTGCIHAAAACRLLLLLPLCARLSWCTLLASRIAPFVVAPSFSCCACSNLWSFVCWLVHTLVSIFVRYLLMGAPVISAGHALYSVPLYTFQLSLAPPSFHIPIFFLCVGVSLCVCVCVFVCVCVSVCVYVAVCLYRCVRVSVYLYRWVYILYASARMSMSMCDCWRQVCSWRDL